MELHSMVRQIRMLVCDVDGVLTDGSITYGDRAVELKSFNIKDGLGIKLAGWNDLPVAWLTGRSSDAVTRRAAELDVHLYHGVADKASGLRGVADEHGLQLTEIAYVGDDLNDIPALRLAGLPIAVADAVPEVMQIAAYVTQAPGGHGAIREIIEYILRGQSRWESAVETYLSHICGGRTAQ